MERCTGTQEDRQVVIQTGRQLGCQTDKQTNRQRETVVPIDGWMDRQTQTKTERQKVRKTERQKD